VVTWQCQTSLEHGGSPVTPAKDLFAFKSSTGSLARFNQADLIKGADLESESGKSERNPEARRGESIASPSDSAVQDRTGYSDY
jgi:hypothetical protein